MCGINGFIDFSETEVSEDVVARMNTELEHRGPDVGGIWKDQNVVLGHRRLSILDVDPRSNQPLVSNDGRYIIVYNGEVYNFKTIRSHLEAHYDFKTESDTEVILAAFIKWGKMCVRQMNGMFAFAIYDTIEKEVHLFRDRMGIKPLYYHVKHGRLIFSSSVKSILSTDVVTRKMNQEALVDYIRFQTVHQPLTMVEGVFSLPAATYLKFNVEGHELVKYWDLRSVKLNSGVLDRNELTKQLKEKVIQAVELRTVSDVPLGAFLSGGIDSSIVSSALSKIRGEQKVNTFSMIFDDPNYSEEKYSRMMAEKLNTHHTEVKVSPQDLLNEIEPALSMMDHPSGDGPNTYLISKATKNSGITVALSGLGSDEVFGGYPVFDYLPSIREKKWLMSFPVSIRKYFADFYFQLKKNNASEKLKYIFRQEYLDTEYIYQFSRQVLLDEHVKGLLKDKKLPINRVFEYLHGQIAFQTPGFGLEPKAKISYAEMETYMQHTLLLDTDQMSMAHALEVRVPFLDHELLEWVATLPDYIRYGDAPKGFLIDAFKDELPEEIYNRKKMGFVMPYEHWMKNELRSFCEEQLNYLKELNNFEKQGIDVLWKKFLKNHPLVSWSRVWHLVVLGHWLKNNNIGA